MGRRRPDWWYSEEQQQQQQHQHQQRQQQKQQQQRQQDNSSPDDGCPRNAANARERARMRVLSKAFGRLKTTLPWVPADTKLSKLDTLRLATTYIAHLGSLLAAAEQAPDSTVVVVGGGTKMTATPVTVSAAASSSSSCSHQSNYAMTWPYNTLHNGSKECSSSEDDRYNRYAECYNVLEPKPYSTYETAYYTSSSINS